MKKSIESLKKFLNNGEKDETIKNDIYKPVLDNLKKYFDEVLVAGGFDTRDNLIKILLDGEGEDTIILDSVVANSQVSQLLHKKVLIKNSKKLLQHLKAGPLVVQVLLTKILMAKKLVVK